MFPLRFRILAEAISIYEISAQTDNFEFLDQIFSKSDFHSKVEKENITTEFCIFELILVVNFKLN